MSQLLRRSIMGLKIKLKDITKEQYDKWSQGCENRECVNCPLRIVTCCYSYDHYSWIHDKTNFSDKFLNNEIEMPVPTEDKALLRLLPKNFKYIARDSEGDLHVYELKPYIFSKDDKGAISWGCVSTFKSLTAFNDYFKYIKSTDQEPTLIEDLLKE